MPRRAYLSNSLPAFVRQHFALTQAELGRFLGVSAQMVAIVEAGRKELGEAARNRLRVLARLLPPPDGKGPAAPVFTDEEASAAAGPVDEEVLRQRLRRLRFYLVKARFELDQSTTLAHPHARRHWALAALKPLLAAPPPDVAGWFGATPDPARDLYWLEGLAIHTAAAPVPLSATERALRLARIQGLEAEIAGLAATLGEPAK